MPLVASSGLNTKLITDTSRLRCEMCLKLPKRHLKRSSKSKSITEDKDLFIVHQKNTSTKFWTCYKLLIKKRNLYFWFLTDFTSCFRVSAADFELVFVCWAWYFSIRTTVVFVLYLFIFHLRPLSKNRYTISGTLKFPDLLKSADTSVHYEDVSHDVGSLSTSIPVAETIENILKRIHTNKELKPLCKKSICKKLLIKLTKESVFSASNRLIKQIDGCPMGGPISEVFSDIYMCKMKEDVLKPFKPIF